MGLNFANLEFITPNFLKFAKPNLKFTNLEFSIFGWPILNLSIFLQAKS